MSFLSHSKNFQGLADVFLHDPKRYLPFVQLLETIMSAESELSRADRERIALHVSRLNDCHYCVDSHTCVIDNLEGEKRVSNPVEPADDKMQAVLKFAKNLTLEPAKIRQEDVDEVRSAGWSDQTIEDVIGVVCAFAFVNRLVDGIGIKASEDHVKQVGSMIARQGYGPLTQMVQQKANAS